MKNTQIMVEELLRQIDTTKFHEFRDYICIQLLLDTGMRISECLSIRVEDINDRAILLLSDNTKGNPVLLRTFEKKLKGYGLRIGLKDIALHTLYSILGHSSVTITEQAYLDLTDKDIRTSYQKFSPLENMKKGGNK